MQSGCIKLYRNQVALLRFLMGSLRRIYRFYITSSALTWSAGLRIVVVLPAVAVLWLAVWWASLDAPPI